MAKKSEKQVCVFSILLVPDSGLYDIEYEFLGRGSVEYRDKTKDQIIEIVETEIVQGIYFRNHSEEKPISGEYVLVYDPRINLMRISKVFGYVQTKFHKPIY